MKDFNKSSTRKASFIAKVPVCDIESSNIAERCKFNFSYFEGTQPAGQDFTQWNAATGICSLNSLMKKCIEYTKQPLRYWQNQRVGGGGLKVMEVYTSFPAASDFTHPPHVPIDVSWARFRLGNKVRVVGFVISPALVNRFKEKNLDSNTFYVVFLDKDHVFYKTEDD
ncbi:hypothetical protein [Aeromonas veronii]|uniref:hypothetical protein n=1 Tax=Aeromonas veronii TaxID=654 RepID=UPI003D245854